MLRVGVTGHRLLPRMTADLVARALRDRSTRWAAGGVIGLTCLADGADQLFAEAVLAAGGVIEVILPAERHRLDLPAQAWPAHDRLLRRACSVDPLPYAVPTPEAHMAAGRRLVDRCDRLVAVWDGAPARGLGGTADVVTYARQRSVPVEIIWPAGAWRP